MSALKIVCPLLYFTVKIKFYLSSLLKTVDVGHSQLFKIPIYLLL